MDNVRLLPGAQLPVDRDAPPPTLTVAEIVNITGYEQPAAQLKALQARGFTRAHRLESGGRVILERSHYEAVTRGQFGQAPAEEPAQRRRPNRAAFRAQFGAKAGA